MGYLDFKKEDIKKLGMRANTCSFNPGVIIANLTEWRNQNITRQLEHWMELNKQYVVYTGEKMGEYDVVGPFCSYYAEFVAFLRNDLYSKTLAESIVTPPLLIVFYKRHSNIDPMWHIRHLGKETRVH